MNEQYKIRKGILIDLNGLLISYPHDPCKVLRILRNKITYVRNRLPFSVMFIIDGLVKPCHDPVTACQRVAKLKTILKNPKNYMKNDDSVTKYQLRMACRIDL